MLKIGYWLSSEEHPPQSLVLYAQQAEATGFEFALISDHFHPWLDRQGQSPFVWGVIGGIAQVTQQLRLGTAVTCPTFRIHPAIIAQAAATAAAMMPERFFLGVGTGENLNEHITGQRWPASDIRRAMLEEAITIIRLLWAGGEQSHYGTYYTVENARLYTLPPTAPPLIVAASGEKAARLAGQQGDGVIATGPQPEVVQAFEQAGGKGKPRYAKINCCWAESEAAARRTVHTLWPTSALGGELFTELPLPAHFEQAVKLVTEEAAAKETVCGPDPERYLAEIEKFRAAGFDHLCLHQIGPDQAGFFRFFERELGPQLK